MENHSRHQDCSILFSTHCLAFRNSGMFKQTNQPDSLSHPPLKKNLNTQSKQTPKPNQQQNTNRPQKEQMNKNQTTESTQQKTHHMHSKTTSPKINTKKKIPQEHLKTTEPMPTSWKALRLPVALHAAMEVEEVPRTLPKDIPENYLYKTHFKREMSFCTVHAMQPCFWQILFIAVHWLYKSFCVYICIYVCHSLPQVT